MSRKKCFTVSTQGLVGANLFLLNVATGFLGSFDKDRNFRNTSMYTQAENGKLLTKTEDVIENSRVISRLSLKRDPEASVVL